MAKRAEVEPEARQVRAREATDDQEFFTAFSLERRKQSAELAEPDKRMREVLHALIREPAKRDHVKRLSSAGDLLCHFDGHAATASENAEFLPCGHRCRVYFNRPREHRAACTANACL